MGEVIQLQGDQRKDVQEFLTDKEGLELDAKTIKACLMLSHFFGIHTLILFVRKGPWFLNQSRRVPPAVVESGFDRSVSARDLPFQLLALPSHLMAGSI